MSPLEEEQGRHPVWGPHQRRSPLLPSRPHRTRRHHTPVPTALLLGCEEEDHMEELTGAGKTLTAAAAARIEALEAHPPGYCAWAAPPPEHEATTQTWVEGQRREEVLAPRVKEMATNSVVGL